MCSENLRSTNSSFLPLLEIDIAMPQLQREWASCDLIANYLAEFVTDGSGDTLRRTNMLSAALNELLESVFKYADGEGHLICRIAKNERRHRVEMIFNARHGLRQRLETAIHADENRAIDDYLSGLQTSTAPGPAEALLGLAVNFLAEVSLMPEEGNLIGLVVDLPFDGASH